MDGINLLETDHTKLRDKISQFRNNDNWTSRQLLIKEIISNVCQHTSAEERYLYDLITQKFDNGKFLYDKQLIDNQVHKEMMQFLLDKIDILSVGNMSFRDSYQQECEKLFSVLEDHMKEEEQLVFPKLRETLNTTELSDLYKNLEWAKQNAPTRPHPSTPVVGSKILHPVAGLVDSLTESLTGTTNVNK
ncbi:hypothetical protein NAEGRDRAFT_82606 [Naegleria gruberi]|uniref:Hemerythrin-like domain-containing protein n=1 Tax=Naegleria gruberi TaxID=5762 RepID=D2VF93_NAEGR|nr:uncharacterized protein NAEGRDRAFT_82606 [Naegleria gruberi]EFC44328.1 hypothetical protein NAEGRDRAFT_82606 [Naegleria gruberi]|eukprot:XP_002677072.1 hypothetical protein NAEGRDRAFT_82606 [Naegleria gruberi strain NEG-M]